MFIQRGRAAGSDDEDCRQAAGRPASPVLSAPAGRRKMNLSLTWTKRRSTPEEAAATPAPKKPCTATEDAVFPRGRPASPVLSAPAGRRKMNLSLTRTKRRSTPEEAAATPAPKKMCKPLKPTSGEREQRAAASYSEGCKFKGTDGTPRNEDTTADIRNACSSDEYVSFASNNRLSISQAYHESTTEERRHVQDDAFPFTSTPFRPSQTASNDSPQLSPLGNFVNIDEECAPASVTHGSTDDKFVQFLSSAGITLRHKDDQLHTASEDPIKIVQNMKHILTMEGAACDEIVTCWKRYMDSEKNLEKSLAETKVETDNGILVSSKAASLTRMLLQVPQLQADVASALVGKISEAVNGTDSADDAPLALRMLQQFRFLGESFDPPSFIDSIGSVLATAPRWFQTEVITFIPDIVTELRHHAAVRMLLGTMEKYQDLSCKIFECFQALLISKEYKEELRTHFLGVLQGDVDRSSLPVITTFVLADCPSAKVAAVALNVLRTDDVAQSPGDASNERSDAQTRTVDAVCTSIALHKEVQTAAVKLVKSLSTNVLPMDFVVLILLYESSSSKKQMVANTLSSLVKENRCDVGFLTKFYGGYVTVAKTCHATALLLASGMLKTNINALLEFGIEWVRLILLAQHDSKHKQREVIEKLLILMGRKGHTAKNVLEALCRMAKCSKERDILKNHESFLRCLLDKLDSSNFDEVSKLYQLLHCLCANSEGIAAHVKDDLFMRMRRQLSGCNVASRCKGALGAAAGVTFLATDAALQLFQSTVASLKLCPASHTLFYDQLGELLDSAANVDDELTQKLAQHLLAELNQLCSTVKEDATLVPRYEIESSDNVKNYELSVHTGNHTNSSHVTQLFKIVCSCIRRTSCKLEEVSGFLGCPILMPADIDTPKPSTANYVINGINWCRELIGSFALDNRKEIRKRVLVRVDNVMSLQGELVSMVTLLSNSYQPAPCRYHNFPMPPFVQADSNASGRANKKLRVEPKGAKQCNATKCTHTTKRTEGSTFASKIIATKVPTVSEPTKQMILPLWDSWEAGSKMTVENPSYFRKLDAKIAKLLDVECGIEMPQVCFLVKELVAMFQHQTTENLIRECISSLPQICSVMQKVVEDLKRNSNACHEAEAIRLILSLLISLFSWEEWETRKYDSLLKDGLQQMAALKTGHSDSQQISREHVVSASIMYFESLTEIATSVAIAAALVKMCRCLMKHAETVKQQYKTNLAQMALRFMSLQWQEIHNAPYRCAVKEITSVWSNNDVDPLKSATSIMAWLPAEFRDLQRPASLLRTMPSVNKTMMPVFLKQVLGGAANGINISLEAASTDSMRIKVWLDAASCLEKLSTICKIAKSNVYRTIFIKSANVVFQQLLKLGMELLEVNMKYYTNEVLQVIHSYQNSSRFLGEVFCTAGESSNLQLLKVIPAVKACREKFIFRVKGMMAANSSLNAFCIRNLSDGNRDEISSETVDDLTQHSDAQRDLDAINIVGDIFESDSEEELYVDE